MNELKPSLLPLFVTVEDTFLPPFPNHPISRVCFRNCFFKQIDQLSVCLPVFSTVDSPFSVFNLKEQLFFYCTKLYVCGCDFNQLAPLLCKKSGMGLKIT